LKNSLKPRIQLDCTLEKSVTKIGVFFARGVKAQKYTELPAENTVVKDANIPSMILPADGIINLNALLKHGCG